MGRHGDNDRSERRKHHDRETEDERLLRKAQEYVEREKRREEDEKKKKDRKSSGSRAARRDEHESDGRSRKSHKKHDRKHSEEDRRKKDRKRHHRSDDASPDRKEKKQRKDSRKHHKKESRQKEKHGESKKPLIKKSDLFPLGDIKGSPPVEPLELERDYFAYHQHLWVYLYREEGVIFGDLTSDDAHKAFQRFVDRYNAGKLEEAYYDKRGLPAQAVEQCQTTRHKWSFQTNETEERSLKFLQEGVRKQTEYDGADNNGQPTPLKGPAPKSGERAGLPGAAPQERHRMTPEERLAERSANRRLRDHVRTAEEELMGGRKEGRERQIEKRKERGAATHGAARDREEARMGGIELNDEAIYGGGGDGEPNYQDALARERHRNAQRQQKKQDRVAELQKKEQDKQEAMIRMLGLTGVKPGQKITIAPRKDT